MTMITKHNLIIQKTLLFDQPQQKHILKVQASIMEDGWSLGWLVFNGTFNTNSITEVKNVNTFKSVLRVCTLCTIAY